MFEIDVESLSDRALPTHVPLAKQQAALRDVALIVDDAISHATLMKAIDTASSEGIVRSARLFDVYRPQRPTAELASGQRSLAVRLELRDDDATLTDERIDAAVKTLLDRLTADGVIVRLRG